MPDKLQCESVPNENLRMLAQDAYQLADQCCGACRDYHALWPYRRLSLNPDQAAPDQAIIETVLAEQIAAEGGRVLIAGSADSMLLATVLRAARSHPVQVTVADHCATPLELCRRFAARAARRIETLQTDLLSLQMRETVDLVYANSVLPFFAPEQRGDFFANLARAVRPGGSFVHVFTTGQKVAETDLADFCTQYADWVLEQLQAMRVNLPASRNEFYQRMMAFAADGALRQGALATIEDVLTTADENGFVLLQIKELPVGLRSSHQRYMKTRGKQRLLVVARRV